ncbi:MAG: sensor histidine kinase [Leptolyngbya sp. PLA1]|nr:sensor histidine kinase [Leptolyngbya sp. PLA1]
MRRLWSNRRREVSPWRVFWVSLLVAFGVEGAIMLVLRRVSPFPPGSVGESVADAVILSCIFGPVLWVVAVRPLRDVSRERGELLSRLIAARDEERARLARDMHDQLGQDLTALALGLRGLELERRPEEARRRSGELAAFASRSLEEVRRIARGLHPAVLEDFGLAVAVRRLCEDYPTPGDVKPDVTLADTARFHPNVESAAYRLVQESLTNCAKHAGPGVRVGVTLREERGGIRVEVSDDGPGFRTEVAPGLGLRSVQERVQLARGELTTWGGPGEGTRVSAWLPATPRSEQA